MSIFGNLFKRKPALVAEDPVFGPLTHDQGIWTFTPKRPGPGFMITIAAPQTGPAPEQRDFFERVRPNLADLHLRARDFIRSRADEPVNLSRSPLLRLRPGQRRSRGISLSVFVPILPTYTCEPGTSFDRGPTNL